MSSPDPCSARGEFLAGFKAEAPLLLGIIPFGLIYGALGIALGVPGWAVVSMCFVILGGSSQIVFVQLWSAIAPFSILAATVSIVNLRHMLYSASVSAYLQHLPWRWKCLLAYLLTDEAYAAAIIRFRDGPATSHRHWFLLGAGSTLWAGWLLSSWAGVLLGEVIPASWSLDFSVALTFMAILVASLKRRSEWLAALAAGATALVLQDMPHKLWILAAAAVGMAIGVFTQRWDKPTGVAKAKAINPAKNAAKEGTQS